MELRADLHVHSIASDGRLSPSELVRYAARVGLSVMALTDHDSAEGVAEAVETARQYPSLLVLPGVEINTDMPHSELHMLGFCMEYRDPVFQKELCGLRMGRLERGRAMVSKLAGLGIIIDWDRVQHLAGDGSVGRPHVAQAILESGYVKTLGEAFDRYIGREGPAYIEREKITPQKAVKLIIDAGGFAVMAHPHSFSPGKIEELLSELVPAGLSGLEVYYGNNKPADVEWLVSIAGKHSLLTSGGSDYHGFGGEKETGLGNADVPTGCIDKFLQRAAKHQPGLVQQWNLTAAR
ncbi:MAG: PHP domain-containing protein [Chloroflexi bacterium]|nr:PHP domain-containing protein [Chloroflexota bacterium]